MIQTIILLLVGLALIVFGADWLVDGASGIARKLGISEFVIGLTIVGFGTSCPELVVSLTGALAGSADISIGNVLGSNIFNTLLILGVTALIMPLPITEANRKIDIPLGILVVAVFLLFGYSGKSVNMVEGIVFLLLFACYMYYCFKTGKVDGGQDSDELRQPLNIVKSIFLVLLGLAGLIVGGQWFVDSAQVIAKAAGVSDKFIAVTLLAGGTSLPELATCIVAASKKKGQLALGNILGSNIFNILLILGCSALVTPLAFNSVTVVDASVLAISSFILLVSSHTGTKDLLDRWEGAILVAVWIAYFIWLFFNSSLPA